MKRAIFFMHVVSAINIMTLIKKGGWHIIPSSTKDRSGRDHDIFASKLISDFY